MNKKNMLGMNMAEWKNLSGLADPYSLELTETAAVLHLPRGTADRAFSGHSDDDHSGDDDEHAVVRVPQALKGKTANAMRMSAIARATEKFKKVKAARDDHQKTFGGSTPTKMSDYSQKQRTRILRKAIAKKNQDESITEDDFRDAFFEDLGSSMDEFTYLLNLAIENNDEEMAVELLAIEDQLDELLGRPMAGGGAPAGAVPPAGAPPAAPAGAVPMAKPAMPAKAAIPAVAPATAPAAKPAMPGAQVAGGAPAAAPGVPAAAPAAPKVGLLGKVASAVQGAGKVVGGIANAVAAGKPAAPMAGKPAAPMAGKPAAPMAGAAKPAVLPAQNQSIDYADDFEAYLGEEHGLTAEQYVAICEHAFATNDVEMIEYLHQMDEGIARFLRKAGAAVGIGTDPDAEDKAKMMHGLEVAKVGGAIKKAIGDKNVRAMNARGQATPASAAQTRPTARPARTIARKANNEAMESLISKQLQYSGYTDEYIDSKDRN